MCMQDLVIGQRTYLGSRQTALAQVSQKFNFAANAYRIGFLISIHLGRETLGTGYQNDWYVSFYDAIANNTTIPFLTLHGDNADSVDIRKYGSWIKDAVSVELNTTLSTDRPDSMCVIELCLNDPAGLGDAQSYPDRRKEY